MPVIPCASVVINVYLMLELDAGTWARFAIWMVLGTRTHLDLGVGLFFLSSLVQVS